MFMIDGIPEGLKQLEGKELEGPLFIMRVDGSDPHAMRALSAYATSICHTDVITAGIIAKHLIRMEDKNESE